MVYLGSISQWHAIFIIELNYRFKEISYSNHFRYYHLN